MLVLTLCGGRGRGVRLQAPSLFPQDLAKPQQLHMGPWTRRRNNGAPASQRHLQTPIMSVWGPPGSKAPGREPWLGQNPRLEGVLEGQRDSLPQPHPGGAGPRQPQRVVRASARFRVAPRSSHAQPHFVCLWVFYIF